MATEKVWVVVSGGGSEALFLSGVFVDECGIQGSYNVSRSLALRFASVGAATSVAAAVAADLHPDDAGRVKVRPIKVKA